MKSLKYSKSHEWIHLEDDIATIGISNHAQNELGDIVFIELPEINTELNIEDELGTIEAVKTVATLYSPVIGKVVEVNQELVDNADIINQSPYEKGWIVKIKVSNKDLSHLLDEDQYKKHIGIN